MAHVKQNAGKLQTQGVHDEWTGGFISRYEEPRLRWHVGMSESLSPTKTGATAVNIEIDY